ncbi:hypothetical protein J4410_04085, partial [Candidatus Woesearchaeota archaeon]|nr:hypothetical protein [Candidatus Woesearchaeota archaeon]
FFLIQITVVQSQSSGIGCCCVQSDPRTPPLSEPLQAGGSCNQEARFRDQTFCTQTCGGTLYDVADLANWGFDLTPPTNCHEICGSTTPPPPPVIIPPGSGECNNPPSNVIAFAGQGRQKITLQWDYPDGCNVQYYEITKTCTTPEHPDCTGGTPQSFTKSFIDSDVLWDQEYSYTIQPRGGTGSPPASSPLRVKVGNIECWGKISATPFCVNNWFYFKFFSTQYQEYMRTKEVWHPVREEWVGYSSGPETTFIEDTYTSRINGAWSCDPSSNSIVPAAPLCSAGVCVVRDGTPTCAQETVRPWSVMIIKQGMLVKEIIAELEIVHGVMFLALKLWELVFVKILTRSIVNIVIVKVPSLQEQEQDLILFLISVVLNVHKLCLLLNKHAFIILQQVMLLDVILQRVWSLQLLKHV